METNTFRLPAKIVCLGCEDKRIEIAEEDIGLELPINMHMRHNHCGTLHVVLIDGFRICNNSKHTHGEVVTCN